MKDLTNLKTYIIDSDDPHEVDDAISLEIKEGNKKNLWIHISNPCKLFLHDSNVDLNACLLYTSPSPRDRTRSRMPSSA